MTNNTKLTEDELKLYEFLKAKSQEPTTEKEEDGFFTVYADEITKQTGFRYSKQKTLRQNLQIAGVLTTRFSGIPRKLYYGIV